MTVVAAIFCLTISVIAFAAVLHALDKVAELEAQTKALEIYLRNLDPTTPPYHPSCQLRWKVTDPQEGKEA